MILFVNLCFSWRCLLHFILFLSLRLVFSILLPQLTNNVYVIETRVLNSEILELKVYSFCYLSFTFLACFGDFAILLLSIASYVTFVSENKVNGKGTVFLPFMQLDLESPQWYSYFKYLNTSHVV